MPTESLTFRYLLTVLKPQTFEVVVNSKTISSKKMTIGRDFIEGQIETQYQENYNVSLSTVGDIVEPVAWINNIEVTWPEQQNVQLFWRMLARAENEIWDYFDPNSTEKTSKLIKGRNIRTLSFDYMLDEDLGNGFINNFGVFKGDDGVTDSLLNNGKQPYIISRPGKFQFAFRAPIAPWLMERLFS
jgi:hypothetical protein